MSRKGEAAKAIAYIRTSSAANVGADKDSDKRQLAAIERLAKSAGFELVGTYYDAAVSGADHVQTDVQPIELDVQAISWPDDCADAIDASTCFT